MSGTLDLERRLATWLEQDGPADVPAAAVEAALAQARTIRQPRAWLTRSWWERRPLVAAPAPAEAGGIEPAERIPTFPVARTAAPAGLGPAPAGGPARRAGRRDASRRLAAAAKAPGRRATCRPGVRVPARLEPRQAGAGRPGPAGHGCRRSRSTAGRAGWWPLTSSGAYVETWTFDVCTNTWTQMHPNREPPLFDCAQLVYDADSDATIGLLFGQVWAYDLQADTWTEKGAATAAARGAPGLRPALGPRRRRGR